MKFRYMLILCLLAVNSFGAFPTHTETDTIDISKIKGNYNSFNWKWSTEDSQSITLTITSDGSTGLDLDAYKFAFKIAQQNEAGQVAYISTTNITVATSNLTLTVAYTNVPPNGQYLCEMWSWEGATTNLARTLAQGKLNVFNSLYSVDDETFPYPSAITNLSLYLEITDAAATYMIRATYDTTTNSIVDTSDAFIAYTNSGSGSIALTNLTEGANITITGSGQTRAIAHTDTSTQTGITNTGGTVLRSQGLDTDGHVTYSASYDLDNRYYTETETGTLLENQSNNTETAYLAAIDALSNNVDTAIDNVSNNTETAYLAAIDAASNNTETAYLASIDAFSNNVDTALTEYVKTNHTAGNVSISGKVSVATKGYKTTPTMPAGMGDVEFSVGDGDGIGPTIAVIGGYADYIDLASIYTNGATTNLFTWTYEGAVERYALWGYHNNVWKQFFDIHTNGTFNFHGGDATNFGLVEADSLKLGSISATVTNIFDSHSISSNALLTANTIHEAIAETLTGNVDVYMSSTKQFAYTNDFGPTNYTYMGTCDEDSIGANAVLTIPSLSVNDYLFAFGCSNKIYTRISGQSVNGVIYISEFGPGTVIGKMEIYRYEIATSNLVEWGDGGDEFLVQSSTTPQRETFGVPILGVTTNEFQVWARFKRTGGTATGQDVYVGVGSGSVSRITFSVPSDFLLEPYQLITGYVEGTNEIINTINTLSNYTDTADAAVSNNVLNMVVSSESSLSNNLEAIAIAYDVVLSNNVDTVMASQSNNLTVAWTTDINSASNNVLAMVVISETALSNNFNTVLATQSNNWVAADAVVTNAMAAQSNNLSAVDAVKANTNHYGNIQVSVIYTRETVLPQDDATPTWEATNLCAYLDATQNVTIAVTGMMPDTTYTLYLDNTASKTIAFASDVLYFGVIATDLSLTNIVNFTKRNGSSVILAKGAGAP